MAQPVELEPLPSPAVDNLERPIQEQLARERARLEELMGEDSLAVPELAAAYGNLCQYYFVYELFEVAEVCFVNASRLAPEDFRWHYYLGAIYRALGNSDEARQSLLTALELRPASIPTLLRLGRIDLDANRLETARDYYQRALSLAPQSAAAHDGLGRIAYQERRYEDAVEHLNRALQLQPSATSIHNLLGLAYRELGDLERARFHLGQNKYGFVTFRDPLVYGLADRVAGASFHAERASKAMARHDLPAAVAAYRQALEIAPDDAPTHYNLAVVLMRLGRRGEAIDSFERAVELDPEHRDSHYNLGVALAEEARLDEALSHFELAYHIDPEDQDSLLEIAVIEYRLGEPTRAEPLLRQILEQQPDNTRARLYLGAVLVGQDRVAAGEAELDSVVANTGDPAERAQAQLLLAVVAERAGRDDEAVERYRSALESDPDLADVRASLGAALARQGRFREAAVEFQSAVAAEPGDQNLRFGHAMTLLLSAQDDLALTALEQSVESFPQSLALQHLLARLLAASQQDSVRDGERALEMARQLVTTRASLEHVETLAMALAELGRFDEAVARQRDVVRQLEAAGEVTGLSAARMRLELYESGEPCRAPWLGG